MEEILGAAHAYVASGFEIGGFLLCAAVSLLLGAALAAAHGRGGRCSLGFASTLTALPFVTATVISLVDGNVGMGIAVLGAFSLVRFRSIAGSSRDMGAIFAAMATGLACGMDQFGAAVLFTAIYAAVDVAFSFVRRETLRVRATVPESMAIDSSFDETLSKHCSSHVRKSVSTAGTGSLYKVEWDVVMRDGHGVQALLDEMRTLNANMKVSIGMSETREEL